MNEGPTSEDMNDLIAAVARALDVSEIEVITAIEQGRLGMELLRDDQDRHYILVNCDDKTVKIHDLSPNPVPKG